MDDPSRIATLEAKVAELTALVERLAPPATAVTAAESTAHDDHTGTSSRRRLLKVAGGAAVAAVAGGVLLDGARPVAADSNFALIGGRANFVQDITYIRNASGTNGTVVTGGVLTSEKTMFWADNRLSTLATAVGVRGDGGANGTGIDGYGGTGVTGTGTQFGVRGSGPLIGVTGVGTAATGIGLGGIGPRAALLLSSGTGSQPPSRTDAHTAGEVDIDANGTAWLCVADGTPGTWRKLGGTTTGGAFHPISQVRVYDSRSAAPTPGKLATGTSRVVSVKDGRDPSSGSVTLLDAILAGATAVTGNITVTNTSGALGGFLTVMPGDATALVGSTINWFGPGQNIANSFVGKLDATRRLKVFAGGAPSPDTDFIIDITGFYL